MIYIRQKLFEKCILVLATELWLDLLQVFIYLKVGLKRSKKIIYFHESPLKMMKNAFYFILKALFVLKIFRLNFWSCRKTAWLERLIWFEVNFKIYDVTTELTNNCNTHIAQYFTKDRQQDNEIWPVNRISLEKYFPSKIMQKMWSRETSSRPLFVFLRSFIWRAVDSL